MGYEDRAELVDYELATRMGNHVTIGTCFAFIKPEFFSNPAFSWLGKLVGRKLASCVTIVNLLDAKGTELAGLKFKARSFGRMDLSSITSDKSLYKADNDTIDLLLLNPLLANSHAVVKVLCNGAPYSQYAVEIGKHGAGKLRLLDLPAGEYEALFDTGTNKESHCKFSVAQYKLVPLVAALKSRQMRSDASLDMTVELSSFGTPVSGPVSIEVFDRGMRQATLRENAQDGLVKFSVPLTGAGPHSLNFQLLDDPTKTASLPIIGSRASERSQTLLNPLGTEIFASLLPAEGASEIRGLYLTEGGLASTPLRLEIDENKQATLKTAAAINSLVILSIDPNFPSVRADAPDLDKVAHPSQYDEDYRAAVKLFEKESFEDSLKLFIQARSKQGNPHAYYAYYAACCHARLGRKETALEQLRQAVRDGWKDFAHMQEDADLSALHGAPEFESIKMNGYTEHSFADLPANHVLEIPLRPALNLLAMAAIIKDQVWEGWTSFVTPAEISVLVENKPEYKSGHSLELKLKITGKSAGDCAAYVLVKDARLLSQDKPEARLAAAIKDYVETESKTLLAAYPKESVATIAATLQPRIKQMMGAQAAAPGGWGGAADAWGEPAASASMSGQAWGSAPPIPPVPPSAPTGALGAWGRQAPAPQQARAEAADSLMDAGVRLRSLAKAPLAAGGIAQAANVQAAAVPASAAAAEILSIQKGQEPEVLHADFVPIVDGEATLVLPLPVQESDYIVECFVISKFDWCSSEARFRAVCDPLAEFTLPRFVNAGELATSWLHVGTRSQELKCCLYHNDKELELSLDQKPFGKNDKITQSLLNLKFAAGPGTYRAVLSDSEGKPLTAIEQTVDEPGKLRRRVRTVRLLREGESFDLKSDDALTAIRVLPGLKQSFNLLIDATADYGHACCEQTAAKVLSACAMFMFAGDDRKRRERAESIIIAGLKREEKMWLRSRGFKSYPERPDEPDHHYGPLAAKHLSNLILLDSERAVMSRNLLEAVQVGVQMSADAMSAYGIAFPPQQINSLQDAYNACKFSNNGINQQALAYVRKRAGDPDKFFKEMAPHPCFGQAVNSRVEAAYASAALMRQRQSNDLSTALRLANHVVKSFNEQGRLYSTVDSVAAIALFAEMIQAKVLGGAGKVEINGVIQNINDAINSCQDIESIRCLEGVAAIELERIEEEDWAAFDGQIPLRVALEKNGQPQRSFKLADQVNLRVRLEQGYKEGDLLWLCLPDCLSRVFGGGQVKLFSVDFAGNAELLIPLAVTGSTEIGNGQKAQQKLALCVRNMFEEERGANPGLIAISASH